MTAKTYVFTSAAVNYIPKVRILFNSLRKYHPTWELHLALADQLPDYIDLDKEPIDHVWQADKLGIPYFKGWSFCHSIVELSTAIKPFVLRKILDLPDCSNVIYLDPDTVLFSCIDEITEALASSNLTLTPHQTVPESGLEAIMDNEISSLKHGIYNLGFVGVAATNTGREFADWWSDRLYHFCRADIPNGLFTDQRWVDLAPAFFPEVRILRSPRFNTASWNLSNRHITRTEDDQFLVNDTPLGFYHFTGFDSGDHHVMARRYSKNNPAVTELIEWYAKEIKLIENDPIGKTKWAYGQFSNGTQISRFQRIVYRERPDLQKAFPDPFDANGYLAWWDTSGKKEYPKLFKDSTKDSYIKEFTTLLTPGFRGEAHPNEWINIRESAKAALNEPRKIPQLLARGWQIFLNEGVPGLLRRIRK